MTIPLHKIKGAEEVIPKKYPCNCPCECEHMPIISQEFQKIGVAVDVDAVVKIMSTTNISDKARQALEAGEPIYIHKEDILKIAQAISASLTEILRLEVIK